MLRSLLLGLLVLSPLSQLSAQQPASPVGRQVAPFTLQDYRGRQHSLQDFADKPVVVLAFLGVECPLAKLYTIRLRELSQQYQNRGVAFIGVNANVQDSITELAAYARVHKIAFPLLKDVGNRVADQVGAVRTPEVFVLDRRRTVRYWGAIDDQYGVGYVREEPRKRYLAEALDQLLAGKQVKTPSVPAEGCHIGRVLKPKPNPTVTYSGQIAEILNHRCVECHREGEIAPFALTNYDEVYGWSEMIAEVVREQRMPPWHADPKHGEFRNDRLMSAEEKRLIYKWVQDGSPQGDASQTPPTPTFTSGWRLPKEPDVVFPVSPQPFAVKAEGDVRYQWFSVDTNFKEDKWLQAAEIQPGNRAVVHHILAFAREPGDRRLSGERGFLVGYVPGLLPQPYPQGMAKRIPAGSKLIFQVHYTPIGSPQKDQSRIGLVFADPKTITHEVITTSAVQPRLRIPPGEDNYRAEAYSEKSPLDVQLLSLMPHIHLRGKAFQYQAVYPDGKREILLDVPRYDFNWQTAYYLKKPRTMPAGARLHAIAHFDNSEANLNNPDPTQTVRWGDQTYEEMMIGYFDIAYSRNKEQEKAGAGVRAYAQALMRKWDKDKSGTLSREELPKQVRLLWKAVDADKSDAISIEELTIAVEKLRKR